MDEAMGETTSRWALRGSAEPERTDANLQNAVALPPQGSELVDSAAEEPTPAGRRDWSSALDLIQEATEAIRLSEERVEELERQAEEQEIRTRAEYAALRDQLQLAQREIENAYARADAAERQAQEANEWLSRLNSAITQGFARSPSLKKPQA